MAQTFQTGIHEHIHDDLTNYALMMGGLNVTRDALLQYDPLRTGYGRLFMIRTPRFVDSLIPEKMKKFKHILEYCNTKVTGLQTIDVDTDNMSGGYAGRQMEVVTASKDNTNSFTVGVYEFSGSPVREVLEFWISGVVDFQSGFGHYHGSDLEYSQANHTAEFIYVSTDPTGKNIEYACLFANCFPKSVDLNQFNYESGSHDLVPLDIEFTATKYTSPQINEVATKLLAKYNVLMNSLDFNCGYTTSDADKLTGSHYDKSTGKLASGAE